MGLGVKDYMLMLGMLLTGSINTISKKIQLDCQAPGITGLKNSTLAMDHSFNKPWLQTLFMFIGETFCLIGFCIIRIRKQRKDQITLSSGEIPRISSLTKNSYISWVFILPTICDLAGTTIAGISLLYIDASVWQMLRGSLIIFVGILSMIFLKRVLRLFHWTGMIVTMIGLFLVGLSSVLKAPSSSNPGTHKVLGVLLVIAGSFVSSIQMVLEEALLKKRGFHPLQVVGSEGLIGCILTGFVALPIVYSMHGDDHGSYENIVDGLYQIKQNALLLVNVILYTLSIAFYNYFGLSVAKSLTAVHRTLIDALRTIVVWFFNLFVFYAINKTFGEAFDKSYGLMQIDGFMFLMVGTMIYNRVMDLNFIPICRVESDSAPVNDPEVDESVTNESINSETERLIINN